MNNRGVTPAVGKALEASIVVLFIALLTATLYGGVVPNARVAAADEVGERVLQHAARSIESAVPAVGRNISVVRHVTLPESIMGSRYEITANGSTLILKHPHPQVGGRTPLVLPRNVSEIRGSWDGGAVVIRVQSQLNGTVSVILAEGSS